MRVTVGKKILGSSVLAGLAVASVGALPSLAGWLGAKDGASLALWSGLLVGLVVASSGLVLARLVAGAIHGVRGEAARLRAAVEHGRLQERAKVEDVDAEFRPILVAFNQTMDAFTIPFEQVLVGLERFSRGDLPEKLQQSFAGDLDRQRLAINRLIDVVIMRNEDLKALMAAASAGRLDVRADPSRYPGYNGKMIAGVNAVLDAALKPIELAAARLGAVARGEDAAPIEEGFQGRFGDLKASVNQLIALVERRGHDMRTLLEAASAGRFDARADAAAYQGSNARLFEGVNALLDAVTRPIRQTAALVDRLAKGQTPEPIGERWPGELDGLRENLDRCAGAIRELVQQVEQAMAAGQAGRLGHRVDPSRAQGDYAGVLQGMNAMLDAIGAPVVEAIGVLGRYAEQDLTARMTRQYAGELEQLKAVVNASGEALGAAMGQVGEAVAQTTSSAAQIAASAQAVAAGATQQASSLQETTSSLELVTGMTKRTADNAGRASTLAQVARAAADEGTSAVAQMQGAMQSIKASAEGTSQIIRDINDIAFQTNLLALNAAVEAARAGEAGRGFAVVAEEVRSLALRSKEAATKTEALIRESVRQAGEGAVTAQHVGDRLSEIASGIGKVTDIVTEIASAAREAAGGIDQVSQSVAEMDKVTQQNAASAEESSAAAAELADQSDKLSTLVSAFRFGEPVAAAGRVRAAPRLAVARR